MVPKLTKSGTAILLNALSGKNINFTKMQLGNGKPQNENEASSLNNPLITVPFTKIDVSENYVALTATFNNSTVESGFRITEVGFFVEDPDDENNEVLYALGLEDSSTADFVPDNTNRVIEMEFEALIFVGEAETVTAAINSSLVYTLKEEFEGHTGDANNPHRVTKAQVGLDKVPNVGTNDQTPTYTEAKTLTELTSGEKLSTLLGKLALAVKNLIAHLSNKKNPHGVTPANIGAAPVSHTHGATDINGGTLPITRGGTGATTAAKALTNLGAAPAAHTHSVNDVSGSVKIATGSYVGDGKYGSTNKNHIYTNFIPRLVILTGQNGGQIVTLTCKNNYAISGYNQATGLDTTVLNVVWSISPDSPLSVAWYSDASALAQFNSLNQTYEYIVIGN